MLDVLKLMVEKKGLDNQYGWQSCFDVPEAYDKMEELANEIIDLINEYTSDYQNLTFSVSMEAVREELESIAFDVTNNNYDIDSIDVNFLTQDDYIETYVIEGMDESARSMFDSLFYFMNSDHRAAWLKNNTIFIEASNMYSNNFFDFVIVVDEH